MTAFLHTLGDSRDVYFRAFGADEKKANEETGDLGPAQVFDFIWSGKDRFKRELLFSSKQVSRSCSAFRAAFSEASGEFQSPNSF